jgi:hypothetical protein
MALNTAFNNRITELIGSDYTTIASNSYIDLFNAAVSEVADMMPTELLLKYAVDPINLTNSPASWAHDGTAGGPEGKKVLLVTRIETSGGTARECVPVSLQDFNISQDGTSIYKATEYSPVYTYTTDGGNTGLTIFPTPDAQEYAKVYYFAYPTTDKTTSTSIEGLPNEVEQAVVLKACMNMLQTYISDFIQDEEDSEMQNMLLGQVQTLKEQFQGEMARFTDSEDRVKGE